jgi:hypothetical protein
MEVYQQPALMIISGHYATDEKHADNISASWDRLQLFMQLKGS